MFKKLKQEISTEEVFNQRFPDKEACLEFLANEKWKDGFVCKKCGHTAFTKGKTPFSRRCSKCKKDESATAHTPFHRCHVSVRESFMFAWRICCTPDISTYKLSDEFSRRQMTCWRLKKKITECLKDTE